jgi:hypothetical protein
MENYLSDETLYFQVYLQAKEEGGGFTDSA